MEFRVVGATKPRERYEIRQRFQSVAQPVTVRESWRQGFPARRVRNPGKKGYHVLTYRVRLREGEELGRELLSDDDYPAMNRLVLEGMEN